MRVFHRFVPPQVGDHFARITVPLYEAGARARCLGRPHPSHESFVGTPDW